MSLVYPQTMSKPRRRDRLFAVLLVSITALAVLLRLGALRSEFWFDEIWSWEFARAAASPWQVFAGEHHHHDNNHKLNTLFLSLYPVGVGWWCYRLHSFAAGLVAVVLAMRTARRRGRAEAVFAGLLFATNYWLMRLFHRGARLRPRRLLRAAGPGCAARLFRQWPPPGSCCFGPV